MGGAEEAASATGQASRSGEAQEAEVVGGRVEGAVGVAVDAAGDIYIADLLNYRIRKVSPNGIIGTLAGNSRFYFAGDGGWSRPGNTGPVIPNDTF